MIRKFGSESNKLQRTLELLVAIISVAILVLVIASIIIEKRSTLVFIIQMLLGISLLLQAILLHKSNKKTALFCVFAVILILISAIL